MAKYLKPDECWRRTDIPLLQDRLVEARKRIETLNIEANLQHHGEKQLNLQLQVATKRIADQAATIERLRGALEPFAIPFDTVNIPEAYGVFLGGLIKNNFIVARQALKEGGTQ